MFSLLLAICLLLPPSVSALERIRTVDLKRDEIVTVKTALAVATIVQVPDRPQSVVVGSPDSFKVEYLDQAVTIKPLFSGAKSNLYIYTDYRRFDVSLVTVSEKAADYVVYLKPKVSPQKKVGEVIWKDIGKDLRHEDFVILIRKVALVKDYAFIDFVISASKTRKIDPAIFWLVQSGKTVPIEKLVLSELDFKSGKSIFGIIQIALPALKIDSNLLVEVRTRKTSRIELPPARRWK